jgi:homogentisate 1,2-dioxygenase
MSASGGDEKEVAVHPSNVHMWTRDGFLGANSVALRPGYTPDYVSADGPHVPQRIDVSSVTTADEQSAEALPNDLLTSKTGLKICVSRRRQAMPFTVRNAEADELHFIQAGTCRFDTDFGSLEAKPMDFVCIPKAVSYRIAPLSGNLQSIILESPEPLSFDTPAPFGMINHAKSVRRATLMTPTVSDADLHILLIKSEDGITRYQMVVDPLPSISHVGGIVPVWALNLADIAPINYGNSGGPPAQFLSTRSTGVMLYSLSARPGRRPPIHHNADYDEVVVYAAGPGAWGNVSQPGTLTHVPKAVTHHGPTEDVPEGYLAWLLETRSTLRFSAGALKHAIRMETGLYGPQPERR